MTSKLLASNKEAKMTDVEEPLLVAEKLNNYGAVNPDCEDSTDTFSSKKQIPQTNANIKVYTRRWYILFVFGMMSMTQCSVWNTFSPISEVGERVFGWDDAQLSLLTNWGPLAYVVGTFGFSWILDEKGLKPACIVSAFLVAAGTGLRCITSNTPVATPLIHVGQFLNGLAGPIAMGAPPALSAEWFPPEQRTTATALATIANTLGLATSFLLGPYLVPVKQIYQNKSFSHNSSSFIYPHELKSSDNSTNGSLDIVKPVLVVISLKHPPALNSHAFKFPSDQMQQKMTCIKQSPTIIVYDVDAERAAVMRYMYYSFGFAVLCLLLFFTYFPSKPPLPPSASASLERLDYKAGLKKLLRNRSFWLICFTYGLSQGVLSSWTGVLDVNLKDHDITQNEASWLGFYGVVAMCVSAFVVARGADIFTKHMKWFLLVLFAFGGGCFLVFALALINIVPYSDTMIYSTYILGNLLLGATSPLFFEMSCEVSYPVAEGVTNLVLTLINNIAGFLFLLVQLVPNIGTMWQNWCLVGSILVCVPALALFKEKYNRLDIDITVEVKISQQ